MQIINRFLDESLRWLVANGKTGDAEKVVRRAARWNNVNPEDSVKVLLQTKHNLREIEITLLTHDKTLNSEEMQHLYHLDSKAVREVGKVERYNVFTIVKHKTILKFSVILWITW